MFFTKIFQVIRKKPNPKNLASIDPKQDAAQNQAAGQGATQNQAAGVNFSISTERSSYYVETYLADNEEITMLSLDGYTSQSGGFVNYAMFDLVGMNSKTGRKNTRHYKAKDAVAAIKIAASEGLVGPYEISPAPFSEDQERMKYYTGKLKSYGANAPDGATIDDIAAIINRISASDDIVSEERITKDLLIRRVRPTPGPNEEFALYADAMGVEFSKFISKDSLFSETVFTLSGHEKAAFFAYCVLCSNSGEMVGDLRKSPTSNRLYEFADMASQNPTLMKSIADRNPHDYLYPHKGTNAYKAVAEFFRVP